MAAQVAGKGRDDLVFSDAYGQHLRRTRVSTGSRSWFKTALRDAELEPMTLHDLRHTAASLAISSGANVKAVQRMQREAGIIDRSLNRGAREVDGHHPFDPSPVRMRLQKLIGRTDHREDLPPIAKSELRLPEILAT